MNFTISNLHEVLIGAGYIYREQQKDYIRKDGITGRFHVKPTGTASGKMHYDNIVRGKHWSPHMPLTCQHEWKRIKTTINI